MLIANPLGELADDIFDNSSDLSAGDAWLGVICYSLQIYFDFSAYSDMAIGLARMFGYKFLENFRYPYISMSLREFWTRWHISLSSWFRDYVYIPLGGNRAGNNRALLNLWVVFILTGFWHGASWNFLIWGAIHGLALTLEKGRFGYYLRSLSPVIQHIYVIFVLLMSWVFFRSDDLSSSLEYLQVMFGLAGKNNAIYGYIHMTINQILILFVAIFLAIKGHRYVYRSTRNYISAKSQYLMIYFIKVDSLINPLLSIAFGVLGVASMSADTYNPFIYFRF